MSMPQEGPGLLEPPESGTGLATLSLAASEGTALPRLDPGLRTHFLSLSRGAELSTPRCSRPWWCRPGTLRSVGTGAPCPRGGQVFVCSRRQDPVPAGAQPRTLAVFTEHTVWTPGPSQ